MNRRVIAVAAAALSCAAALVVPGMPARADEPAAEAPKSNVVQWVEGWAAGRAAARERGKLMLVYVHRVKPG